MLCSSLAQSHEVYLWSVTLTPTVMLGWDCSTICDTTVQLLQAFTTYPTPICRGYKRLFQLPFSIPDSSLTYADSDTNAGISASAAADDQPTPGAALHMKVAINKISPISSFLWCLKRRQMPCIKVICSSGWGNIKTHVLHLLVGGVLFIML